jgi:murein DD-endopeptidase MepM/ murein hydrolase activator NlpD
VGIDSKEVHATISGTVHYAGWENPSVHTQGFGQYVCIRGTDGLFYYYGHLSQIKVKTGQTVTCTDVIGIEGSTGHSTGSHCHYEIRGGFFKGAKVYDVCSKSGIPNVQGGTYDDGYRPKADKPVDIKAVQNALNAHGYNCGSADGIIGPKTTAAMAKALSDLWC